MIKTFVKTMEKKKSLKWMKNCENLQQK